MFYRRWQTLMKELNRLIVKHVLELPMAQEGEPYSETYIDGWLEGHSYTVNVQDAMKVVEKLRSEDIHIKIDSYNEFVLDFNRVERRNTPMWRVSFEDVGWYLEDRSLPYAICCAALERHGIETKPSTHTTQ